MDVGIISPADGNITNVIYGKDTTSIVITLNLWNKHYQISPINGIVKDIKYKNGKFLNAVFNKNATFKNERNEITINNIRVIQIAGILARRIKCYVKKNQKIKKGEKIGKIAFGSQVILEIPKIIKVRKGRIKIGDRIEYQR